MKRALTLVLMFSIFTTYSYALTPFSLEGIKSVNVKVIDKSKLVSKDTLTKIQTDLSTGLIKMGIQVETSNFLNFLIKIQAIKLDKEFAVHVSLSTIENIIPQRDKNLQSLGITYYKDDMFTTDELDNEVYESALLYLLASFEEQYLEEK